MSGPISADRAKAADWRTAVGVRPHHEPCDFPDNPCSCGAAEDRYAIAAALPSERAAAVTDLRARVRDWIGDVAFRPNDIVLGQTAVTADQLPDLHRLLDALDPEWRDWTDGAKRDRRAAVTGTTGGAR